MTSLPTTVMRPGDIIVTGAKSQGIVSWAIKLGQRLRGFNKEERQWSHCMLVLNEATFIEAAQKGVRLTSPAVLHDGDWELLETHVDEHDLAQIQAFCRAVLASKQTYGFWTFAGLALYCLTGSKLCVQRAGTSICSGLVSDALTRGQYVWPRPPYAMMPGDLYRFFKTA